MKRKDLMKIAFERRPPQEMVPLWEIHFHAWSQASGRHFIVGSEFAELTAGEQEQAIAWDADLMVEVAARLGFSGVTIPDTYWEIAPGAPTYYWLPKEARLALAQALHTRAADEIMVISASGGVLGIPGSESYLDFSYKLFDAPEEIDEMARKALAEGIEGVKRVRDAGVEAVYAAADIADNHGPYFSPPQMNRFVLPYLRAWAEEVKAMRLYAMLHSDGNLAPVLDDLANSGIHALQAIDPVSGMDIRKAKAQVGDRLCLCGNVDSGLLVTGPAQNVYEQTRDLLIDCKAGGGLILGASNAVFHETPIENYAAMNRAWKEFGRYQ
jgi:uroporphyrinogen decarboxylase